MRCVERIGKEQFQSFLHDKVSLVLWFLNEINPTDWQADRGIAQPGIHWYIIRTLRWDEERKNAKWKCCSPTTWLQKSNQELDEDTSGSCTDKSCSTTGNSILEVEVLKLQKEKIYWDCRSGKTAQLCLGNMTDSRFVCKIVQSAGCERMPSLISVIQEVLRWCNEEVSKPVDSGPRKVLILVRVSKLTIGLRELKKGDFYIVPAPLVKSNMGRHNVLPFFLRTTG